MTSILYKAIGIIAPIVCAWLQYQYLLIKFGKHFDETVHRPCSPRKLSKNHVLTLSSAPGGATSVLSFIPRNATGNPSRRLILSRATTRRRRRRRARFNQGKETVVDVGVWGGGGMRRRRMEGQSKGGSRRRNTRRECEGGGGES